MTSRTSEPPRPLVPSRIQVLNKRTSFRFHRASVAALCARVLEVIGLHPAAVTIVFVGAREMQALNARHRGRDYATDVLSFTYPEEQVDGLCFLGEVVIAPQVAARNAREDGIG